MSRMFEALKQIEAKRCQLHPPETQFPVADISSTDTSGCISKMVETASTKSKDKLSETELPGLHPSILEELDAIQSSLLSMQSTSTCRSNDLKIASSNLLSIDGSLAQAETAVASALSLSEPDIFEEMAQYVLARLTPSQSNVLLFTSPSDGAGNTETLFALSRTLATLSQDELLVVDANFRSPVFTRMCKRYYPSGLEEVLGGSAGWQDAIHKTDLPNLNILPNKGRLRYDNMPYSSRHWGHLLEQLKRQYQLVLLDAPSLAHAQTSPMISLCDGVYLVIRLGYTTPHEVNEAVRVIQKSSGLLLGSIAVGEKS
jgi:Mrp family chromosome partitioning ATPase